MKYADLRMHNEKLQFVHVKDIVINSMVFHFRWKNLWQK